MAVSDALTLEILGRCTEFEEKANKEAEKIMKEMKAQIDSTTPKPYPYRQKHMQGGWKTSIKKFKTGVTSYAVYNKNVPQLTHLVTLGHRIVTYSNRITAHAFWVTDTEDTGRVVKGNPFMDNARDAGSEKLDRAIERLIEEFNNGE